MILESYPYDQAPIIIWQSYFKNCENSISMTYRCDSWLWRNGTKHSDYSDNARMASDLLLSYPPNLCHISSSVPTALHIFVVFHNFPPDSWALDAVNSLKSWICFLPPSKCSVCLSWHHYISGHSSLSISPHREFTGHTRKHLLNGDSRSFCLKRLACIISFLAKYVFVCAGHCGCA